MVLYPQQVLVGGKWSKLEELTQAELTAFVQLHAFDSLMKGTPFGTVIADVIQYASWWANRGKQEVK